MTTSREVQEPAIMTGRSGRNSRLTLAMSAGAPRRGKSWRNRKWGKAPWMKLSEDRLGDSGSRRRATLHGRRVAGGFSRSRWVSMRGSSSIIGRSAGGRISSGDMRRARPGKPIKPERFRKRKLEREGQMNGHRELTALSPPTCKACPRRKNPLCRARSCTTNSAA